MTGLTIGVVSSALFLSGAFERLETKLYDSRLSSTPLGSPLGAIVMVRSTSAIDADVAARIIDASQNAGVRAVVFNDPIDLAHGSIEKLTASAIAQGRVVFAYRYTAMDLQQLRALKQPGAAALPRSLQEAAAGLAFNDRLAGPDQVLRRFTPTISDLPEIGIAVASASIDTPVALPRQAPMLGEYQALGPAPRLLIPYQRFEQAPAVLTSQQISRASASGKTLLIGSPQDRTWRTPIGQMSDLQVTGQIATALLQRKGITRAPIWLVVLALIGVSVAITIGAEEPNPVIDFGFPVALGLVVWILGGIFLRAGTWIDTYPLEFALLAQMIVVPLVRGGVQRRRKRPTANTFFEALLETMIQGCFATSGCAWRTEGDSRIVISGRGAIPEHIVSGIRSTSIAEINRDEGQVVFVPMSADGFSGGVTLIRPRSMTLSRKRLSLIEAIAQNFANDAAKALADPNSAPVRQVLRDVAAMLDEKDHFPTDHPDKIARIALAIARKAGVGAKDMNALVPAAFLHDVGKIGVPDSVIDNTDRLSDEDYEKIKQHTIIGSAIIGAAGLANEIQQACAAHHERWDGKGYPVGLVGEDIPVPARVLAVADALASMLSERPYRRALSLETALEEIASQRGRMFDPWLVEAALEIAIESPQIYTEMSGANLS
ncbi:MAG: HD domain-containing phosphohydrolase [Actinomycetota bacterium]